MKVRPDFDSISQKNDVFVNQFSSLVFNNTDTLLLSYFCGLKTVSVYSIYLMMCNMINTIVDSISSSMTYQFGFWYSTDKEKFTKAQKVFERYYLCVVFWLYSVTLVFLIPFISLYTKGVTDANYVDAPLPFLFVGMQLLSYTKRPFNQVVNMAQKFKETKWRSVAEATINITISFFAVRKYGIYGVLLGSIVALSYRVIDLIIFSNRILDNSILGSMENLVKDVICLCLVYCCTSGFVNDLNNYLSVFFYAAVVTIFSGMLFFSVNLVGHKSDLHEIGRILKRAFK